MNTDTRANPLGALRGELPYANCLVTTTRATSAALPSREQLEVKAMYATCTEHPRTAGETALADRVEDIRRSELAYRVAFVAPLAHLESPMPLITDLGAGDGPLEVRRVPSASVEDGTLRCPNR